MMSWILFSSSYVILYDRVTNILHRCDVVFIAIATETPPPAYDDHDTGASCVDSPMGGSSIYSGGGCGQCLYAYMYVHCILSLVGSPIMSPTSMGPGSVPSPGSYPITSPGEE